MVGIVFVLARLYVLCLSRMCDHVCVSVGVNHSSNIHHSYTLSNSDHRFIVQLMYTKGKNKLKLSSNVDNYDF